MKLARLLAAAAAASALAAVALVGKPETPPADRMADAARKFLDALSPELRDKASFAFDSPERLKWHFIPLQDNEKKTSTRKGVRFEEMSADQKEAALALLRTGTSEKAGKQAVTIMGLEGLLGELEKGGPSKMIRNPGWYFVAIFGKPGDATWGWRLEGHHLAVNVTVKDGKIAAASPYFFGANPAEVKSGPRKGERTLPEVEDLARELVKSLDDAQKKLAQAAKEQPDVEPTATPQAGEPQGIPAAKLTEAQRKTLRKLIEAYADRMPGPVAQAELAAAEEAGMDKVHFSFSGSTEPGQKFTYRVQGPTFLVQFLSVQADGSGNPANHIHSVWRHLPEDFGVAR